MSATVCPYDTNNNNIYRKSKPVEIESQLVIAWGWGWN